MAAVASAVSELRPGTSVDEVKTKFAKLRSHFVAELGKKKKTSEKSGTSPDEVYEPNIWYFKKLLFLVNHITPRKGVETKLKHTPVSRAWEPLVVYDDDGSMSETPNNSQFSEVSNQATSLSSQPHGLTAGGQPGTSAELCNTLNQPPTSGQPGTSAELCKTLNQPPTSGQPGTSTSLDSVPSTPKAHKKQKVCNRTSSEDGYTSILNSVVDELKKEQPRLTENERFGQWLGCALDNIKDRGVCMATKHEIMKVIMAAEVDDFHKSQQ